VSGSEQRNIIILTTHDHEFANPQGLYLASSLVSAGNHVTFVGPIAEIASKQLMGKGVKVIYIGIDFHQLIRVQGIYFVVWYSWLFLNYLFKILLVTRHKADQIIGINTTSCRAAWFLYKLRRTKSYVCYLLDIWSHWLQANDKRDSFNNRVWSDSELIVLSNQERCDLFAEVYPHLLTRLKVLHNAPTIHWPDQPIVPVSLVHSPLSLCYTGNIGQWSNLSVIIRAIALSQKKVYLAIAGVCREPWYMEELQNIIKEYKIEEQISFAGYIPRDKLVNFVNQAHATVCFYAWRDSNIDVNFKLCAPNKVYESLALGRPVIASDNPTLTFLSKNQIGWNVNIDEVTEVANLLQILANNPDLLTTTGLRARNVFENTLNFEKEFAGIEGSFRSKP
jgi:glycosyltransferase involved in cell wall biosynthesis